MTPPKSWSGNVQPQTASAAKTRLNHASREYFPLLIYFVTDSLHQDIPFNLWYNREHRAISALYGSVLVERCVTLHWMRSDSSLSSPCISMRPEMRRWRRKRNTSRRRRQRWWKQRKFSCEEGGGLTACVKIITHVHLIEPATYLKRKRNKDGNELSPAMDDLINAGCPGRRFRCMCDNVIRTNNTSKNGSAHGAVAEGGWLFTFVKRQPSWRGTKK